MDSLFIKEYVDVSGRSNNPYPLITVGITVKDQEKFIDALADTGYDGKLIISHENAVKIGLDEHEKINAEPYEITVASGDKIKTDIFIKTVRIGKIKSDISFLVTHENVSLIWPGIVGRELMHGYVVIFDEKSNPKKTSIQG